MDVKLAAVLVAYVVLVGSLATSLYDPLSDGRDDSWALLVLLAGAHLGLGVVVRRAWVLLLPGALTVTGFVIAGGEGLAWLILMFEGPAVIAVTALGWLLGRRLGRHAAPVAVAAFVLAAFPGVWAALESAERGPALSSRARRDLPTGAYTLVQDLCSIGDSRFDRSYFRGARRRARREFAALERGLRSRPNAVVAVRFVPADSPGTETREITVRELAETHLQGAEPTGLAEEEACYRSGRARLQRALDQTG